MDYAGHRPHHRSRGKAHDPRVKALAVALGINPDGRHVPRKILTALGLPTNQEWIERLVYLASQTVRYGSPGSKTYHYGGGIRQGGAFIDRSGG